MISEKQAIRYCKDDISKIENYEQAKNDPTQVWVIHHRLETFWWWTTSPKDLISQGMYYHRPASELIFLTRPEHIKLHHTGNKYWMGRKHTDESKNKMSKVKKGNHYRLGRKHSEESKKKMGKARWGEKNPAFGKHWFNNGAKSILARECPEGFVEGRL